MESTEKSSVLIVDDEATNIITLTHILGSEYTIYAAKNGHDAIEIAGKHIPDVILLDILMPVMDGYEVFSILKKSKKTQEIPIIFVTGLVSVENEEAGLKLGAADYITKPFHSAIVKLRVRNQIQIVKQISVIRQSCMTDQLTNLPNRRSYDSRFFLEWEHAKRNQTPLSILLADIDDFKQYNDTHGHVQGDLAMQAVANILTKSLSRSIDFVARWGGEEFAILLPGTESRGALYVAERIRRNIENTPIAKSNGETTSLTISIGAHSRTPLEECSAQDFFAEADQALYTAKNTGKNKVCKFKKNKG
jgi:diguanylate cyclase (GGDEF)-like protein